MQTKLIMDQLKSLGFKVSSSGVLTHGVFDYGVLRLDGIVNIKGEHFLINDFSGMEFNDGTKVLTFHADGQDILLTGGHIEDLKDTVQIREIPTTTASFDDIFEELFPDWRSQLYYDELNERDMMNLQMLGGENVEIPIDDKIVALYHHRVEKRLIERGFFGKRMVSRETMDEVLAIRLFGNTRNHFREWVEGTEWTDEEGNVHQGWDGIPRLSTYFQDVFGAEAPALTKKEEAEYLAGVAIAWFVGGITRAYRPNQLDVVPVLIGGQGAGKTRSLRYTAGDDRWFGSTAVDITAPGGVESFLDSARGKIVLEMGEATQLRTKDSEKLKQFISQDVDSMRKKYEKHNSDYPRHFILAATTNIENLFTDITGNRRYFPFLCDPHKQTAIWSVNDRSVDSYNIRQVWAEARYL